MKKILLCVLGFSFLLSLAGCHTNDLNQSGMIAYIQTDKAMYSPTETVQFELDFNEGIDLSGAIEVEIYHLTEVVDHFEIDQIEENLRFEWVSPEVDFVGYLALVKYISDNKIEDYITIGIDISSDWSKYPRYGYLSDYSEMSESEIQEKIAYLNRYHLNGLQFYDWQYKHHVPLKTVDGQVSESWQNIANTDVYYDTVNTYINIAHEYHMKAMNYNLIFGAYQDYTEDGLSESWGLYKDTSLETQDYHPLPSSWATSKLMLMDPRNEDWRAYLLNQEQIVFNHLGFDGWHMDQLGYRGILYNYNGSIVKLDETYGDFINFINQEMDIDIVFNLVNDYGLLDILTNEELAFIYTEIWNITSYIELINLIQSYENISNKNVVIAGYMNYDLSDSPGEFNLPGVLLANATIFASGGSHIEMGDHGLLGNEYFPNDNLVMTETLEQRLIRYYDFLVAYENCLRDDVDKTDLLLTSDDVTLSKSINGIMYMTKAYQENQIIHLINYTGNGSDWRDALGKKVEPEIFTDFKIKIYVDTEVSKVSLATPDYMLNLPQTLEFREGTDETGNYIEVNIPYLEYWDMLIIE